MISRAEFEKRVQKTLVDAFGIGSVMNTLFIFHDGTRLKVSSPLLPSGERTLSMGGEGWMMAGHFSIVEVLVWHKWWRKYMSDIFCDLTEEVFQAWMAGEDLMDEFGAELFSSMLWTMVDARMIRNASPNRRSDWQVPCAFDAKQASLISKMYATTAGADTLTIDGTDGVEETVCYSEIGPGEFPSGKRILSEFHKQCKECSEAV